MQAELFQQVFCRIAVIAGSQARFHIVQRRSVGGKIRFLRQIADRGPGLHEAAAAIGLDQARRDLEQGRLTRAVAANQADALGGRHGEFDAAEQRRAAEGQRDVFELNQRRRHGFASAMRFLRGTLSGTKLRGDRRLATTIPWRTIVAAKQTTSRKRACPAGWRPTASRPTTPQNNPKTRFTTIPWLANMASRVASCPAWTSWPT